jgi:hypothetical protein
VLEDLVIQVVRLRVRVRIRGGRGISLITVPKLIKDQLALRIKGLEGVGMERNRLVTDVVKRAIMQLSVEIGDQELFVSTVKSRVIL